MSSRRPELAAAFAVAFVGLLLGTSGLLHLRGELGKTFGGFLWGVSHHGGLVEERTLDGGFIITYTPSSWPALQDSIRWNDVFVAIDGRPIADFSDVLEHKQPGDEIRYSFVVGNQWGGDTFEVVLPAEEFTLDKFVESAGIYYIASLVFIVCGLTLVALPLLGKSRLSAMAGWTLLVAGVYELSGLRSTYAASMRDVSLVGDLTWHLSFAAAGTVLILLASELSLGESARSRVWKLLPALLLITLVCTAYGLTYLLVDFGFGRWWLGELVYAALGGVALILATLRSSVGLAQFLGPLREGRDYRALVSLPFIVGALIIFLFALFPEMLGGHTLLPTETVVPLVSMLPVGLLYSVLAARGLEERDQAARVAQTEAARAQSAALANEVAVLRYRSEVSRFKGVLHNDILGNLQGVLLGLRERSKTGGDDSTALGELSDGLQSLVGRIREEALAKLNAEQPIGNDFPSPFDVEKLVLECLNTRNSKINVDESLFTCSEDIRKLLYVHLHTMLLNAAKHGRATEISIDLRRSDTKAVLVVEDNGSGFDTRRLIEPRDPTSAGLREAIDVARACGGEISVESEPGRGTRIVEELPVALEPGQ